MKPAMVRFDSSALYAALDTERRARGMTWTQVSADTGVSTGTITRTRNGGRLEVDGMLAMVRWLGVPVETFVRESKLMTIPTDRRPIGFWLKLVDRLIDTRLEASLGGLSRRHWQVLNVVRQGRASQAEIDARVRPFIGSEGTTAQEVADLQQRGWLTSGGATLDLTELGAIESARLLELVSADRTTLMIGIAPEEYASTVSVLERMARNLGWTLLEDRPRSTDR